MKNYSNNEQTQNNPIYLPGLYKTYRSNIIRKRSKNIYA